MKNAKVLVICLFMAGAVIALAVFKGVKPKSRSASPLTYTVRSETYRDVIDIAGNIEAAQTQELQVVGAGKVTAVFVVEGDTVSKGDVILELDATEQIYNLARHDYDMDQKRITGAARELSLMAKQRSVLLQRIADRRITASFDGIIARFTAAPGNVYELKDSVGVIVDRSYLKATVEVVETDAPKLRFGQTVTLTFPAYRFAAVSRNTDRSEGEEPAVSAPLSGTRHSPGASGNTDATGEDAAGDGTPDTAAAPPGLTGNQRNGPPENAAVIGNTVVTGRVHSFPAVASKTTRGAAVVKAEIRIDDPPDPILPGYSFTGEIVISPPREVVLVERAAIERRGEETYALRVAGERVETVSVVVRPYGADLVEVLSGLRPGDVLKHLTDSPVSGRASRPGPGAPRVVLR